MLTSSYVNKYVLNSSEMSTSKNASAIKTPNNKRRVSVIKT
jgi:hypothetical protein